MRKTRRFLLGREGRVRCVHVVSRTRPISAKQADAILHLALGKETDRVREHFLGPREDVSYKPMHEALWDKQTERWFLRGFWGFFGHVEVSIGKGEVLSFWDKSPTVKYRLDKPPSFTGFSIPEESERAQDLE